MPQNNGIPCPNCEYGVYINNIPRGRYALYCTIGQNAETGKCQYFLMTTRFWNENWINLTKEPEKLNINWNLSRQTIEGD